MDERYFARFDFKMSFRQITYIAQPPCPWEPSFYAPLRLTALTVRRFNKNWHFAGDLSQRVLFEEYTNRRTSDKPLLEPMATLFNDSDKDQQETNKNKVSGFLFDFYGMSYRQVIAIHTKIKAATFCIGHTANIVTANATSWLSKARHT